MFKRVPWKRKRGGYVTPKGVQVHESESCRAELWLEYFEYGFEHRVRGSGIGTHPVGDVCRGRRDAGGERILNSRCDSDQGIGWILVVHPGRCSRISSVYRVFQPAGVGG